MQGLIVGVMVPILFVLMLILWNRARCKGKMLCVVTKKDKSVAMKLCELRSDFVIYEDRAYDVYPDFVRVARFPMGWPSPLQELVPVALYQEEDAIPLDWINLDNRLERSMELRAALDENWLRKLVQEAAAEGGMRINWRRIIPIVLMVLGVLGLIFLLMQKGCLGGGA